MLAPVAEADFGEQALTGLIRAAEGFAGLLRRAGGGERRGSRLPRVRHADRRARRATTPRRSSGCWRSGESLGLPVERLRPSQARRAEPALAPTVRLRARRPRGPLGRPAQLVAALATAVQRAGGEVRRGARAAAVTSEDDRVTGVRLDGGEHVPRGPCRPRRRRLVVAARRCARPGTGASGQGPDPAPARPARPRPARAHRPRAAGRLPRPARRRRATCSARRSRSAASTPRRPRAACSSSLRDAARCSPA